MSYRLGWIEACIRYAGRFGPREKALFCQLFSVSNASVSRDQALFQSEFEAFHGREIFKTTPEGRPLGGKLFLRSGAVLRREMRFLGVPSIDRWLEEMFGCGRFERAEVLRAGPNQEVLRAVVQGIEDRCPLLIHYLEETKEAVCHISPHALVKVADRYHVRAFNHAINQHLYFVLSRILHANLDPAFPEGFVGSGADRPWNTYTKIRVAAVASDDGSVPRGVCLDFDLDKIGQKTVRVRRALVDFLIDDIEKGFTSPVSVTKLDLTE